MRSLPSIITAFTDETGAAFLEYGLLITLIAGVVAVALGIFGPAVAALFDDADLLGWLTP
jgi:Flp pilus assembly pilin Flp